MLIPKIISVTQDNIWNHIYFFVLVPWKLRTNYLDYFNVLKFEYTAWTDGQWNVSCKNCSVCSNLQENIFFLKYAKPRRELVKCILY